MKGVQRVGGRGRVEVEMARRIQETLERSRLAFLRFCAPLQFRMVAKFGGGSHAVKCLGLLERVSPSGDVLRNLCENVETCSGICKHLEVTLQAATRRLLALHEYSLSMPTPFCRSASKCLGAALRLAGVIEIHSCIFGGF